MFFFPELENNFLKVFSKSTFRKGVKNLNFSGGCRKRFFIYLGHISAGGAALTGTAFLLNKNFDKFEVFQFKSLWMF